MLNSIVEGVYRLSLPTLCYLCFIIIGRKEMVLDNIFARFMSISYIIFLGSRGLK